MSSIEAKRRGPRTKRAPRKDTRRKITVPVTDAQFAELSAQAGGKTTVAELVRTRLFGGKVRNHDVLRQVAALHALGLRIKQLAESRSGGSVLIQATLLQTQAAIRDLAQHLPRPGDLDEDAS